MLMQTIDVERKGKLVLSIEDISEIKHLRKTLQDTVSNVLLPMSLLLSVGYSFQKYLAGRS